MRKIGPKRSVNCRAKRLTQLGQERVKQTAAICASISAIFALWKITIETYNVKGKSTGLDMMHCCNATICCIFDLSEKCVKANRHFPCSKGSKKDELFHTNLAAVSEDHSPKMKMAYLILLFFTTFASGQDQKYVYIKV